MFKTYCKLGKVRDWLVIGRNERKIGLAMPSLSFHRQDVWRDPALRAHLRGWRLLGAPWLAFAAMSSPGSRLTLRRVLVAVAVLLVVVGGAVAYVLLHSPGNNSPVQ